MFGAFTIEYDHPRVLATAEGCPVDVVADYARLVELLSKHGPAMACRTHARWAKGCSS